MPTLRTRKWSHTWLLAEGKFWHQRKSFHKHFRFQVEQTEFPLSTGNVSSRPQICRDMTSGCAPVTDERGSFTTAHSNTACSSWFLLQMAWLDVFYRPHPIQWKRWEDRPIFWRNFVFFVTAGAFTYQTNSRGTFQCRPKDFQWKLWERAIPGPTVRLAVHSKGWRTFTVSFPHRKLQPLRKERFSVPFARATK